MSEPIDHDVTKADTAPDLFWTRPIKILVLINIVFVVIIVLGFLTVVHALKPSLKRYAADFIATRFSD